MPIYQEPLKDCQGVHVFVSTDKPKNGDTKKPLIAMTYCLTSGTKNLATFTHKDQLKFLRKGQNFNGYYVKTHTGPYNYSFKMWTRRQLPFPPLNLVHPKPDDTFEILIFDKNGPYYAVALESFLAYCTEESLKEAGYDTNFQLPHYGVKAKLTFAKNRPIEMAYVSFKAIPVPPKAPCSNKRLLLPNFDVDQLIKDQAELRQKASDDTRKNSNKSDNSEDNNKIDIIREGNTELAESTEDDSTFKSLDDTASNVSEEKESVQPDLPKDEPNIEQTSASQSDVSTVNKDIKEESLTVLSTVDNTEFVAIKSEVSVVQEVYDGGKEPHELVPSLPKELSIASEDHLSETGQPISINIVESISGILKTMAPDVEKEDEKFSVDIH